MKPKLSHFLGRLALFAIPWVLLLGGYLWIELKVLPIDFYNFRSWEALKVHGNWTTLQGYFYPNMGLEKLEEGDLAHGTPGAVVKKVQWRTDAHGYRNDPGTEDGPEVVLVGDSFTAGSSLTQSDTLSSQLSARTGKKVYCMAPATINEFLDAGMFASHPPKTLVIVSVERYLPTLPSPAHLRYPAPGILERSLLAAGGETLLVLWDRMEKRPGLNRLISSLDRWGHLPPESQLSGPLFVLTTNLTPGGLGDPVLLQTAKNLGNCRRILKAKGIRMIFLSIPNKETVYFLLRPDRTLPLDLPKLDLLLDQEGVEHLDLQGPFLRTSQQRGKFLYHRDDTHWNRLGVEVAARLLAKKLEGSSRLRPNP